MPFAGFLTVMDQKYVCVVPTLLSVFRQDRPYFLMIIVFCQIPHESMNYSSDQHRAFLRINLGLSV